MIILSYDISNNKLRTRFSKFLCKYSHRIQYSVFEIENSKTILDNVITQIKTKFENKFSDADSIYIFNLSCSCEVIRMGYAKHEEEEDIIIVWALKKNSLQTYSLDLISSNKNENLC